VREDIALKKRKVFYCITYKVVRLKGNWTNTCFIVHSFSWNRFSLP